MGSQLEKEQRRQEEYNQKIQQQRQEEYNRRIQRQRQIQQQAQIQRPTTRNIIQDNLPQSNLLNAKGFSERPIGFNKASVGFG